MEFEKYYCPHLTKDDVLVLRFVLQSAALEPNKTQSPAFYSQCKKLVAKMNKLAGAIETIETLEPRAPRAPTFAEKLELDSPPSDNEIKHHIMKAIYFKEGIATYKDIWREVGSEIERMQDLGRLLQELVLEERILSVPGGLGFLPRLRREEEEIK